MTQKKKVVLAYSGGLDTSVAIKWLQEQGYDVVACCLDVGEGKDLAFVQQKALQVGASNSYVIDAKEEFAKEFALTALQAHTLYEGKYPLVSALSRPLIAKKLVEVAEKKTRKPWLTAAQAKGMTKCASRCRLNRSIRIWRCWHLCANGNGLATKRSRMQKSMAFQFRSILTARIQSTRTCGAEAMNAESWKILGPRLLKERMI